MNDDNITIPLQFHLIHLFPPARTGTAGYAAEKDRVWKNPYIIYAGNAETPKKIIRKNMKKALTLNRAMLYNTVVQRLRETNPGTGIKEFEKSSKNVIDTNTKPCYSRDTEREVMKQKRIKLQLKDRRMRGHQEKRRKPFPGA